MVVLSMAMVVMAAGGLSSSLSPHPWREKDATNARQIAANARMNCIATGCEGTKCRGKKSC